MLWRRICLLRRSLRDCHVHSIAPILLIFWEHRHSHACILPLYWILTLEKLACPPTTACASFSLMSMLPSTSTVLCTLIYFRARSFRTRVARIHKGSALSLIRSSLRSDQSARSIQAMGLRKIKTWKDYVGNGQSRQMSGMSQREYESASTEG